MYSHGSGSHRGDHTIMVQELAGHGYAVVTVDHTHDAFTEFPDGRVGSQISWHSPSRDGTTVALMPML
ncbi:hypothetical protein [Streptomyces sp. Y2F8-2]|uniref:hypothetical protein n=1 Tax=Streptomyces sp. Y2F8-2 TaxID=2759675 RepID=UPI001F344625|nr:hypothetical protein [Streptomyces sp. Y2F8-2]